MKQDRMKVVGLSSRADVRELICAVGSHIHSKSNIKIYESFPGACKAFADLLKRFENEEIVKELMDLFSKSNCTFIASWNLDDIDSDYRARIDMSSLSILTSLKIIKLDRTFKKLDIKKEKEIINKQKEDMKVILSKLKNKKR